MSGPIPTEAEFLNTFLAQRSADPYDELIEAALCDGHVFREIFLAGVAYGELQLAAAIHGPADPGHPLLSDAPEDK